MGSAVELDVSLPFDVAAAAAGFGRGAEAACAGGEEGVVGVALWLCVAALSALVPGVGFKSSWSGDGVVVVLVVLVGVVVLGSSVPCGPNAFGLFPELGATVDVGAAAVRAEGGAGVRVGLAEPVGARVTPAVDSPLEVDPEADGEPGAPGDVVADEAPRLAAGEEVGSEAPRPEE